MNTFAKLKKLAAFPNPFSLGMKALGSTLSSPGRAIGRAATRVAKIPGIGDRAMGAVAGATLGADQAERATDSTGGAWAGALGGAALGGAFGLSGRRAGGVSRPAQRAVSRTLVGGGAGQLADLATENLGYQTNFAGIGAVGGGLAANTRFGKSVGATGNQVLSGASRHYNYMGDKVYQGWRRLKGLPAYAGYNPMTGKNLTTPVSNASGVGPKPKIGTNLRAADNIGVGLGTVPIAAGAYGVASGLGQRAVDSVVDTGAERFKEHMDNWAGERLPQFSQFVQDQADQYAGTRLPAITQAGLQQLQEQGLLSRDGGVRVNVMPDWMRNPSQAAPAQWLRGLYQRYMNQPRQNGVG